VLSQSHVNISTIKDPSVQLRSLLDTGEEERRKLRRSRGSNVILDGDNVDFPSSPLSSPNSHSKKIVSFHSLNSTFFEKIFLVRDWSLFKLEGWGGGQN
jgi:hypothetical protein